MVAILLRPAEAASLLPRLEGFRVELETGETQSRVAVADADTRARLTALLDTVAGWLSEDGHRPVRVEIDERVYMLEPPEPTNGSPRAAATSHAG